MARRDWHDLIGGLLMAEVGTAFALAAREYDMGTLRRMGSGMFPMVLGWLLAGLGVLVALPAAYRSGTLPTIPLRPYLLVLFAVLTFAFTVDHVGMVPATIALVVLAGAGDREASPVRSLMLGTVLAGLAVLVFTVGLSIPIPAFTWRF